MLFLVMASLVIASGQAYDGWRRWYEYDAHELHPDVLTSALPDENIFVSYCVTLNQMTTSTESK
jgi:hypothetical protein